METNTILAIHAVANLIITILALGLYYMAFQSFKRHKKIESENTEAVLKAIFRQQPKVREPVPYSEEEHSDWLREMQHKDELIPFRDWLAKRREAASES